MPTCWRPSPPTPFTKGVTLPQGLRVSWRMWTQLDVQCTEGACLLGPNCVPVPRPPICVQAYFFLCHWEHVAKSPHAEHGASSPAAGRWECWLMDCREAKKIKKVSEVTQSCLILCDPKDYTVPAGVCSLSLPQGIFPTQGLNPGFPHCRQILNQLSHKRSPRILEWVACPFSGNLPDTGIEPGSPALQADSLPTELLGKPQNYDFGLIIIKVNASTWL